MNSTAAAILIAIIFVLLAHAVYLDISYRILKHRVDILAVQAAEALMRRDGMS